MGVEPCKAAQLNGTFKVIPGSPGAGSISYRLRLTNHLGRRTCFVSGLVGMRLLGRTGKATADEGDRRRSGPGSPR